MKRVFLNLLIVLNISFSFDSDWINNELSKYGCNDYQFEEDYQFIKDFVRNNVNEKIGLYFNQNNFLFNIDFINTEVILNDSNYVEVSFLDLDSKFSQ